MLRLARLLLSSKPMLTISQPSVRMHPTQTKNFFFFSLNHKHNIFELLASQNLENNLDRLALEVQPLDEGLRRQVFYAVVQKIYQQKLPMKVLQHQKFNSQLKTFPEFYFEAYYFCIIHNIDTLGSVMEGDKKQKKALAKSLSDHFKHCFEAVKKMEAQGGAPKEIMLLQGFAKYNHYYLSQIVGSAHQKEVIAIAKETYKLTLTKIANMLKKFVQSNEIEEQTAQNEQQQQRAAGVLQIELGTFELVQAYSQTVSEMIALQEDLKEKAKNQYKARSPKKDENEDESLYGYGKETLALESWVERAVKNYSHISKEKARSKHYFSLKKVLVQFRQEKRLRELMVSRKSNNQKQKQLGQLQTKYNAAMQQLYSESLEQLKNIQSLNLQPQDLCKYIMTMIAFALPRFSAQIDADQSRATPEQLGEEVRKLMGYIKNQTLRKKTLVLVIGQLKQELGVKIDQHVQKLPRNFKLQRRRGKADQ